MFSMYKPNISKTNYERQYFPVVDYFVINKWEKDAYTYKLVLFYNSLTI